MPVVGHLTKNEGVNFEEIKQIADEASERVKGLKASKGRSRYLGGK